MSALDQDARGSELATEAVTEIATEIGAAVRQVSGVAALYRSGARLLKLRDINDDALVLVEHNDDALSIRLSIGVAGSGGAAAIARRAHAAVAKVLKRHGVSDPDIHLTVVHIE